MSFSFRRLYFKIVRAEGSPKSIARGVAIGLTTGLIIPIGLQTVPALALAVLLKANKVLTWSFTCVTNPATVFFIYPVQCYIGSLILFHPLTYDSLQNRFGALVKAESMKAGIQAFLNLGWDIMLPFFAGGILFAVVAAIPGYWISYRLTEAYQKRRAESRRRRMLAQMQKKKEKQA